MNYIAEAIITQLQENQKSRGNLAEDMQMSHAAITNIISGKRRPAVVTLNALCMAFNGYKKESAIAVLIGHLRDEVEHSGLLHSDISITAIDRPEIQHIDIERDIDTIRNAATKSELCANLLNDLAALICEIDDLSTIDSKPESIDHEPSTDHQAPSTNPPILSTEERAKLTYTPIRKAEALINPTTPKEK